MPTNLSLSWWQRVQDLERSRITGPLDPQDLTHPKINKKKNKDTLKINMLFKTNKHISAETELKSKLRSCGTPPEALSSPRHWRWTNSPGRPCNFEIDVGWSICWRSTKMMIWKCCLTLLKIGVSTTFDQLMTTSSLSLGQAPMNAALLTTKWRLQKCSLVARPTGSWIGSWIDL